MPCIYDHLLELCMHLPYLVTFLVLSVKVHAAQFHVTFLNPRIEDLSLYNFLMWMKFLFSFFPISVFLISALIISNEGEVMSHLLFSLCLQKWHNLSWTSRHSRSEVLNKVQNCVNSSLNWIFSWVPQHNWSVGECVSWWRKVCVVNWQLWRLLDIQSALAFHEILVVVLSDVTLDTLFDGWGLRWVDVLGGWMLSLYWWFGYPYCDGLVQERRNTLEFRLSCTCW